MEKNAKNHAPKENIYNLTVLAMGSATEFTRAEMKKIFKNGLKTYYHYKTFSRYMKDGLLPEPSGLYYNRECIFSWVAVGLLKDYAGSKYAKKIMKQIAQLNRAELFIKKYSIAYFKNGFLEPDECFLLSVKEALKCLDGDVCIEDQADDLMPFKGITYKSTKSLKKKVKSAIKILQSIYHELERQEGPNVN